MHRDRAMRVDFERLADIAATNAAATRIRAQDPKKRVAVFPIMAEAHGGLLASSIDTF